MDISVIVPVYNVEDYLKECVESIRTACGALSAEILLVDDESTDQSGKIAENLAKKDPGIHYLKKQHGGLSAARNFGVSKAVGKYLFFVDSDDVLVGNILEKMFLRAEGSGAEMTICEVGRLVNGKVQMSPLNLRAFHGIDRSLVHITEFPQLVYDCTAWNKLILRDFYLRNGFAFSEGYTYEDMPVTVPMHCQANRVFFVHDTGYLWRIRGKKSASITQELTNLRYLEDKIAMISLELSRLKEFGNDEVYRMAQVKICEIDFDSFINQFCDADPEIRDTGIGMIADFYREWIDPAVAERLPLSYRQIYEYVVAGDMERLMKVRNHKQLNYPKVPITESGELLLPNSIYSITGRSAVFDLSFTPPELALRSVEIEDGDQDGGNAGTGSVKLAFQGFLYRRKISVREPSDQSVRFALLNEERSELVPLETFQYSIPDRTSVIVNPDDCVSYSYDYSGSGVGFRLDLRDVINRGLTGDHFVFAYYEDRFEKGNRITRGVHESILEKLAGRNFFLDGYRITIDADIRTTLRMHVKNTGATEKISVLVPVRDDEAALRRCLESLRVQTYEYLEILLLCSAPDDESLCVCREFAKADDRFRVLELSAGSAEAAVNAGLDACTGNFVVFADAGDLYAEQYVRRLYDVLAESGCGFAAAAGKPAKDETIESWKYTERKEPQILRAEDLDYTKKRSRYTVRGIMCRRETVGENRLNGSYADGADQILFAVLARRAGAAAFLDETLRVTVRTPELSAAGGSVRERYRDIGMWEKIAHEFESGPELPKKTAELNALTRSIEALKANELCPAPDRDLREDLILRCRGKEELIDASAMKEETKKRMKWYIRHPSLTLKLYGLKHRNDPV